MFDFLTDWIKGIFGNITQTATGIVNQVTKSPSDVFGSDFWNSLMKIGTSVIMPFAILILCWCMAFDLYHVYCRSNGSLDMELVTITFVKYIIPFICITCTYDLLQFFFTQINNMIQALYKQVSVGTGNSLDTSAFIQQVSEMDFGQKFALWLQLIGPWLCTGLMSVVSTVVIYGRLFEIVFYWIFAPIPFATFVNDNLRSSIGMNFVKMFFALVLQGGFIVVAVSLYLMIIKSVTIQTSLQGALAMMGYSAVLMVTLAKTGSLSKRLLGTF